MCAPKVIKTGRFLTEIFHKNKGGRFYWDTGYITRTIMISDNKYSGTAPFTSRLQKENTTVNE